jgi:hypothetical protein
MPNWSRQSAVVKPFFGRWDPDYNIQWHVFQYIGRDWAAPGCSKTTAELVKYATDVVKGGGVFTFDIGTFTQTWHNKSGRTPDGKRIGPYLEIPPDQFKQLEAVRDALKDIPVSDGSGK